jgi:hypothetical protein
MLYVLAVAAVYHLLMRQTIRVIRPVLWAAALAAAAWLLGGM